MNNIKKSLIIVLLLSILMVFTGIVGAQDSTVNIALGSEPSTLNPITFQDYVTKIVINAICDPLVGINNEGKYTTEGSVLKDYTIEEKGKVYIFEVKEGIEFHNGEKLTAEDVKFTYESLMDKDLASPHRSYYTDIENLELLDEYTLKVTLKNPNAIFLSTSRLRDTILPKDYINEVGWDEFAKNPIGSGPYKFESYSSGQKIVLEKNENYWGNKANIDKVEFRFFPENATAVMALQKKEVDFMELPPKDFVRLKDQDNSGLSFGSFAEFTDARICFNKRPDSIFSNVKLRQAVAYAINRENITALVEGNMAVPAVGRIPRFHPAYSDEVNAYEHNPEKAKELLKEAGYPDGFETKIFVSSGNSQRVLEVQQIQQDLANVGIDCEVVALEWGTYLDVTGEGEAPMYRENWPSVTIPEPYSFVSIWDSDSSWNPIFGTYENEEVDKLIAQIKQTIDPDERYEIYKEVQKIAIGEVASYPLYWPVKGIGYNDELNIPEELFTIFKMPSFHINEWSFK
ncbi:MAG TPA: ABC transporter substrate-binding protein [Halanaerobiales bacterium]|nr:ABC transporter substrate-binding protein [Halanaerobiales bacterium]